jgi:protease I
VTYELASTHVGGNGRPWQKGEGERTFEDVLLTGADDYYALMIVGGPGTQVHLWNNRHLMELINVFHTRQKVVAGIGNAPIVIAKAGILKKKIATVAPGPPVREMMKEDAIIQNKPVVYKDRIVTAMGPEAAEEFASVLIKYEKGDPEFVPTSGKAGFAF